MKKLISLFLCLSLLLGAVALAENAVLEGDANVDQRNYPSNAPFIHPPFYNVKVTVEVDSEGKIVAVKDNGTGTAGSVQEGNKEFWANKNKPYFDVAVNGGIFDKFAGLTLDEAKALDMSGADAVTGATMVSEAVQEAVVNALEGKQGKTFLPGDGTLLKQEAIENNQVILAVTLPEDFDLQVLDVRYGVRNAEDGIVAADTYTAEYADGKLTLTFNDLSALKAGYYYVNVVDASGKYRSPSFEGGLGASQAGYFVIDSGLTADDISFDGKAIILNGADMQDYLNNIEHVIILAEGAEKATEQEIIGHHGTIGSFIALTENGELNVDGVVKARNGSENPLFEAGVKYTVTVASFGFPELTFDFTK